MKDIWTLISRFLFLVATLPLRPFLVLGFIMKRLVERPERRA